MDGIINVYKEAGFTSFDVVAKLRGILHERKLGHTGTLDPAATGVLPICIGRATKLCELMLEKEKTYEAVMILGITTDSEDMTGEVLTKTEAKITNEQIEEAARKFTGKYNQLPPMFSAVRMNGKHLYELVREGKEVEREPRPVEVYENTPTAYTFTKEGFVETVTLTIRVSKGTYIRSIIRDMGEFLGCGACTKSLLRSQAGAFSLETAKTLKEIEEFRDAGRLSEIIIPIDGMLLKYPKATVPPEEETHLYNGNSFPPEQLIFEKSGRPEVSNGSSNVIVKEKQVEEEKQIIEGMQVEKQVKEGMQLEEGNRIRIYDTKGVIIGLYEYKETKGEFCSLKMFLT